MGAGSGGEILLHISVSRWGIDRVFKGLTVVEVPGKPADSSAGEAVPVLPYEEPQALPPLPAPVRGDRQSALLLPPPLLLYSQQGASACGTT